MPNAKFSRHRAVLSTTNERIKIETVAEWPNARMALHAIIQHERSPARLSAKCCKEQKVLDSKSESQQLRRAHIQPSDSFDLE
ncbi:hypothetical protein Trydic_g11930 [Trypoxylus dichotomus]